jgi:hypothetical protein
MLTEIPGRLAEHAKSRRAAALEAMKMRAAHERKAMVAAGIEPKERALAEARHKLAATEATLEAKTRQLAQIEAERDALMKAGDEGPYGEAVSTIAAGDAQDDVAELYREARRTETPADEAAVRRVEEIDGRIVAADQELRKLRQRAAELSDRRHEVEVVRDRFRGAGYDHPHVIFGNDRDIGRILAGVLEGVVRSGILWDIIRGGFGTREPRGRPDFGGPSFPLPFPIPGGGNGPSGGGWRIPESQGGWFPSGGGGSRDDDDFKTGGSF